MHTTNILLPDIQGTAVAKLCTRIILLKTAVNLGLVRLHMSRVQQWNTPFRCHLPTRSLLQLTGSDVYDFLQGLFTNDVRQLRQTRSMWGCFLFYNGRVFCDAYLYNSSRNEADEMNTVLVDVHTDHADTLLDYLQEMRMRRKIAMRNVSHKWGVVAALQTSRHDASPVSSRKDSTPGSCLSILSTERSGLVRDADIVRTIGATKPTTPHSPSSSVHATVAPDMNGEVFVDARNFAIQSVLHCSTSSSLLGHRSGNASALSSTPCSPTSSSSHTSLAIPQVELCKIVCPRSVCVHHSANNNAASYDSLLLRCGIGEGPTVFRHDKTLPFEANADFLGGISFHKGCYVGQELTHRTHVMLVTRRRTVALRFDRGHTSQAVPVTAPPPSSSFSSSSTCGDHVNSAVAPALHRGEPHGANVCVGDGLYVAGGAEKVGEVTSVCGCYGVGLIRLRYVDPDTRVIADMQLKDGTPVRMSIPPWWPAKEVKKLLKKANSPQRE